MKIFILSLLFLFSMDSNAQYIAVRAKYTETRLVDDAPNPPKRENHLVLYFFDVPSWGTFIPANLVDYDLWVWKEGYQYNGSVAYPMDSTGNNMPGYAFTAPRALAYYNSYGLNYIECDPNAATHYVVNGNELDCGWTTVSYWGWDYISEQMMEFFPAPNVCLPFYFYPDVRYVAPGNSVNFYPAIGGSFTWYNYLCNSNWNQFVVRGVLGQDTTATVTLPVRFVNVKGEIDNNGLTKISWSNMTESDILRYEVEASSDGINFLPIDTTLPTNNFGGQANYFINHQQNDRRIYYRIKATENNGNSFYSIVITLNFGRVSLPYIAERFTVYPNPVVNGNFTIQLTNAVTGRYVLSVIDQQGNKVRNKMIQHNGGDITQQVDLFGLFPGVYNVMLWSAENRFSETILFIQ